MTFERPAEEREFWHYVELHERAWGTETYRKRPQLQHILASPVVVFWWPAKKREDRHYITLHLGINELQAYVSELYLKAHVKSMDRHLFRIYIKRRRVYVHGLQLRLSYEK